MIKKLVIASDSFKGSLSSQQVADSVARAFHRVFGTAGEILKFSVADGGEGTMESLVTSLGGKRISITAHDPLMRPIEVRYGIVHDDTAVIEMAVAGGLTLLAREERNPMLTSTYGVGEMIADALQRGCRKLLIGIGGSATNDAGCGLLQALGYRFLDAEGQSLGVGGRILSRIEKVDDSKALPALAEAQFTIACDVNNPFSGSNGAACIYAPQKGADTKMVADLDKGLKHFSSLIRRTKNIDLELIAGTGAAGGLGGGMLAFLNARLAPGIDMVLDAMKFDEQIRDADLIITGEGKLDLQTRSGKAPYGILKRAMRKRIPVIAIAGSVEAVEELNTLGFTAVFPIIPKPLSLEEAMESEKASMNVEHTVTQIFRTIAGVRKQRKD